MSQEANTDLAKVSKPFNQGELFRTWQKWQSMIEVARKSTGQRKAGVEDQYRVLYEKLTRVLRREQQYGSRQYRKLCYQGEKLLKPWVHLETLQNAEKRVVRDLAEQVRQTTEQLTPRRIRLARHWFSVGSLSIAACVALMAFMVIQSGNQEIEAMAWIKLKSLQLMQLYDDSVRDIPLGFRLMAGAICVLGVGFLALKSSRKY